MHKYPYLLVIIVLLLAILACGSEESTSVPIIASATPMPGEEVQPEAEELGEAETPTEIPLPRLGETIENYGYSFSAVQVEDPATPGMLYEAEEGTRLVGVEVIVGNVERESFSVNPLYCVLIDADGFTYQAELASLDHDQIATGDILPGEKVKGWVGFKIPVTAVPARIKYDYVTGDVLIVGLEP